VPLLEESIREYERRWVDERSRPGPGRPWPTPESLYVERMHGPDAGRSGSVLDQLLESTVLPGRIERLLAELREEHVPALDGSPDVLASLVELSYALRPHVHEGRVPTYGAIVPRRAVVAGDPPLVADPAVTLIPVHDLDLKFARRFADGLTTFSIRAHDTITHIACFERDISAEYDLVGLQVATGALVVQRHRTGQVRIFGPSGVVRWDGIGWHHDAPLDAWMSRLSDVAAHLPIDRVRPLLRFAVHELGGRRIGAALIWRPVDADLPTARIEWLVHNVPRFRLSEPGHAAAIAHALSQTDGAAIFDEDARLRAIGIRLTPSAASERHVEPIGGMRHTAAVRYSNDDPNCLVIVVSEAGPVTIMHRGAAVATVAPSDDRIG
jgi:hypothetical protein